MIAKMITTITTEPKKATRRWGTSGLLILAQVDRLTAQNIKLKNVIIVRYVVTVKKLLLNIFTT